MSPFIGRAQRAFDALVLWKLRRRRDTLVDRYSQVIAERLHRRADRVANYPFRSEFMDLPEPLALDGSAPIDVVSDLVAFTKLPRATVEWELSSRSNLSFRAEWHATPREFREDHWFYLAAKGYLFANATHFPDTGFVDAFVRPHVGAGGHVLDFGGGTGNLAFALAAGGFRVTVSELNALQRDFIRFRVLRHGVGHRITVLDWWDDIPRDEFDAVVAVDVLEHLADASRVLGEQLVPALKAHGVLVENSPFVVNTANPMHHEDFGFEHQMAAADFRPLVVGEDRTRVWSRSRSPTAR